MISKQSENIIRPPVSENHPIITRSEDRAAEHLPQLTETQPHAGTSPDDDPMTTTRWQQPDDNNPMTTTR
eukprot:5982839-Alexandrium_andersonii.AAC.1